MIAADIPPAMTDPSLVQLIKTKAREHGLAADLVAAVVCEESRGIPTAMSGGQKRLRDRLRACYGLMQVQWETAWVNGFFDEQRELLHPDVGLMWGCRVLRRYIAEMGSEYDGIRAYNAGRHGARDHGRGKAYAERIAAWRKALEPWYGGAK